MVKTGQMCLDIWLGLHDYFSKTLSHPYDTMVRVLPYLARFCHSYTRYSYTYNLLLNRTRVSNIIFSFLICLVFKYFSFILSLLIFQIYNIYLLQCYLYNFINFSYNYIHFFIISLISSILLIHFNITSVLFINIFFI